MADAKYTDWLTSEKLTLLKSWKDQGLLDHEIAQRIGINKATLYEWKQKYPEFAEATRIGCRKAAGWLTPEGLASLRAMKAEGLSDHQITMKLGISSRTLNRWRKRYPAIDEALQPPPTQAEHWLTQDNLSLLRSWKAEGTTDQEIASRIGICRTTLKCWKKTYPELAEALQRIPPKYKMWLEPQGLAQLKQWKQAGFTDQAIAQMMGVSVSSLVRWKRGYPQIAEAMEEERPIKDYVAENALFRLAVGYFVTDYRETEYPDGSTVKVERSRLVQGNTRAQILWLRNRKRDQWGK